MNKKAVVLLSGGIDSATALFMAKKRGFQCHCLIFDYGQRHIREIDSAKRIARLAKCEYKVLKIALPWKGSALTDRKKILPKARRPEEMKKGIPSSYVPSRNTIFLSFASSFAEVIGAYKIFIGANSIDFSGYPDCRASYLRTFECAVREGTKAGQEGRRISIEAPLLFKTKSQIIKVGQELKVPYGHTWSCYEGRERPCGSCDPCILRKKGFYGAYLKDPLIKDG